MSTYVVNVDLASGPVGETSDGAGIFLDADGKRYWALRQRVGEYQARALPNAGQCELCERVVEDLWHNDAVGLAVCEDCDRLAPSEN